MHLGLENSVEVNATWHGCVGIVDVLVAGAVRVRVESVFFCAGFLYCFKLIVEALFCPSGG